VSVLLLLVLIQRIEVMVMAYNTWGSRLATLAALAVLSMAGANPAHAQFGKRLKDAVKRTAEDKAIQKATDEESKAIDGWCRNACRAQAGSASVGQLRLQAGRTSPVCR
jgi:hypothetical protein